MEAMAKRRLADEYDAAQERGEVAKLGDNLPSVPNANSKPTAADLGVSRKEIHEARKIRDAEKAQPGVVKRALTACLAEGAEPGHGHRQRLPLHSTHWPWYVCSHPAYLRQGA